jgi:hypothetical protein
VHYYQALMQGLRTAIIAGMLPAHITSLDAAWDAGDPA